MRKFFKASRVKLDQLLNDISEFTKELYNQSDQLYSPASPWGQIITVLTRLTHLILYYVEDSITELNIYTASRPHSIYSLAALAGHNPTRAISAMGDLYMVHNGVVPNISGENVIIPNFIKLKCFENGLTYLGIFTSDELRINIFQEKEKKFLKIIQGEIETQTFTGTGRDLQSYEVNMTTKKYIDNYFVNVYVNSEKWKKYESLYDIPKGEYGFIVRTGLTSGIDIMFGNGYFGSRPALGSRITVEYLITDGESGNIRELSDVTFEFEDTGYDRTGMEVDLNEIFNLGIATPISFGANPENTRLTRILAPHTSRSFVLANTINYIHFFEKFQYFSYVDAYTRYEPDILFVDNIIYLLLIPDVNKKLRSGENYFTVPIEFFYLTDIEKFKIQRLLEESGRKIVTAIVEFVNPVFKKYVLNINLGIWEGYDKTEIRTNVINMVSQYMLRFQRKDYLPKSDLIRVIEDVEGVDSVSLYFISENIEQKIKELLTIEGISAETEILTSYEKEVLTSYYESNPTTEDKVKSIFTQVSFKDFALTHVDMNGDIKLDKNEIPLMRGGFTDRFGRVYYDLVNKNKLSSVNIAFIKETKRETY